MLSLKPRQHYLVVDLSNVVARACAVTSEENYLGLLARMVLKLRRQYPHCRFVYALEGHGTKRRQKLLPSYKASRAPSPEFVQARAQAIEMLQHTVCTLIRAKVGEADDAIATFVHQHPEDRFLVLSNDRDLWQLVGPRVTVLAKVKRDEVQIDRFACERWLGVPPVAVPLFKGLLGDTSDEIGRGVPRVAADKLRRLAKEAKTADAIRGIVKEAAWLSRQDKERIRSALPTVKQQEQVARVWHDLDLREHDHPGDIEALQAFLESCAPGAFSVQELKLIAGVR